MEVPLWFVVLVKNYSRSACCINSRRKKSHPCLACHPPLFPTMKTVNARQALKCLCHWLAFTTAPQIISLGLAKTRMTGCLTAPCSRINRCPYSRVSSPPSGKPFNIPCISFNILCRAFTA